MSSLCLVMCMLVVLLMVECFILAQASQNDPRNSELQVLQLVAVVTHRSGVARTRESALERGLEILPGARVAVEEVNRNTDILPGYQLELVEIITETCEDNLALVKLIQHSTTSTGEGRNKSQTVGIIGPVCNSEAVDLVTAVAGHPRIGFVHIATTQFPLLGDGRGKQPYLFQMLPFTAAFTNAVIKMMKEFGRRKLVILCSSVFLCRVANKLAITAQNDGKVAVADLLEVRPSNVRQTLALVRESGAKIVIITLAPSLTPLVVCSAVLENMSWPEYGWILSSFSYIIKDFENSPLCKNGTMGLAIEGLIIMDISGLVSVDPGTQLVSGYNYSTYNSSYIKELNKTAKKTQIDLYENFFAPIFYDSVWAFALALNQLKINFHFLNSPFPGSVIATDITSALLNLSVFCGAGGPVGFDAKQSRQHLPLQISQIRNGQFLAIGLYDHTFANISINRSLLPELPCEDLEVVYDKIPLPLMVLFITITILFILFLTILLLCHIHYQNEPEVKATKLAHFMYVGCYLILFGTLCLTIIDSVEIHGGFWRIAACQLSLWLTNLGLFVFCATLLVRMVRVYRVFSHFGYLSQIYTNRALSLIILGLVLVMVLILTVWAAVDAFQVTDYSETRHPEGERSFIEVTQYCNSDHYEIWISMVAVYAGLVLLGIVILAVKTRTIRSANFKDTKKVNFLVLILIMTWTLFPSVQVIIVRSIDIEEEFLLAILPFLITALSYQLLLLSPKVWPPLSRNLKGTVHVRSKIGITSSRPTFEVSA